jgi:hypothetical protein
MFVVLIQRLYICFWISIINELLAECNYEAKYGFCVQVSVVFGYSIVQ